MEAADGAQDERERRKQQAERAEREAAAQRERLLRRASVLTAAFRRFLVAWTAARQAEADSLRAAQAARAAKQGKGSKKRAPKKGAEPDGKKRALKTPVAEAWSAFMTSLDELVNKSKRVVLEDLYAGVELLEPSEQVALRRVLATANKQVLPTEGMNLNQLSLKEAVVAAAAAHSYVHDQATFSPSLGLAAMRDRGTSARDLLDMGFKEADVLRAGLPRDDVIEAAHHDPAKLRAAGLGVADLLAAGLPPGLQGRGGVARLRAVGYSASELVQGGVRNVWDLREAGFSAREVLDAGIPAEELRPAGYGVPELQPASFLAASVAVVQGLDPRLLLMGLEGTQAARWQRLLQPEAPLLTLERTTVGRVGAARASVVGGPRPSTAGVRVAGLASVGLTPLATTGAGPAATAQPQQ